MTEALNMLLEAAKRASPSPADREQQRRSFAYGNTKIENNLITREMVDRQAEEIDKERQARER